MLFIELTRAETCKLESTVTELPLTCTELTVNNPRHTKLFRNHRSISTIIVNGTPGIFDDWQYVKTMTFSQVDAPEPIESCARMTSLTEVTIDDVYTEISAEAFLDCTSLVTVKAKGINILGKDAFRGCTSIQTVELGPTIDIVDGVVYGPDGAVLQVFPSLTTLSFTEQTLVVDGALSYKSSVFCARMAIISADFMKVAGLKELPAMMFDHCDKLAKVDLPTTITTVNNDCFIWCVALKSVALPNAQVLGVTCFSHSGLEQIDLPAAVEIKASAFKYCVALSKVSIGSAVTTFASTIFEFCTSLVTISIASDAALSDKMFANCYELSSLTLSGNTNCAFGNVFQRAYKLTHLTLPESMTYSPAFDGNCYTEITIPSASKMTGFTWILSCPFLQKIDLPDSFSQTTAFDIHALFTKCRFLSAYTISASHESLKTENGVIYDKEGAKLRVYPEWCQATEFEVPASVEKITDNAFENNMYLKKITFAEGTKIAELDDYAFTQMSNLREFALPDSVTKIGKECFKGCFLLTAFSQGAGTKLTKVNEYAFSETQIGSFIFPPTMEGDSLGKSAFEQCTNLTTISIKDSKLTEIKDYTFKFTDIHSLELPATITKLGAGCFLANQHLTLVSIPPSMVTIGSQCFAMCPQLTSTLTIPSSVMTIGSLAFAFDTSITKLIVENGELFQSFSPDAFFEIGITEFTFNDRFNGDMLLFMGGCPNLRTWGCADGSKVTNIMHGTTNGDSYLGLYINGKWVLRLYGNAIVKTDVTIPDNVNTLDISHARITSISFTAQSACDTIYLNSMQSMTKLSLPKSLTMLPSLGGINGDKCPALQELVGLEDITYEKISSHAFTNVTIFTEFVIPSSVTSLQDMAFFNCPAIKKVTFPDEITRIPESTFEQCSQLESVILPSKLDSIDENAFYNCTSLGEISFPDELGYIKDRAFALCSSLKKLTIPQNVELGDYAFESCTSLTDLTANCEISITPYCFQYCTNLQTAVLANVQYIWSSSFTNCYSLSSITFGDTVNLISNDAFNSCYSLKTINLNKVTKIGEFSFANSGLVTIEFGECQTIEQYAFANCTSLGEIDLNNVNAIEAHAFDTSGVTKVSLGKVDSVGVYSFAECTRLASVIFTPIVRFIDENAFLGCSALTNIDLNNVGSIRSRAFANCTSLKTAKCGPVTYFNEHIFANCTSLVQVESPNVEVLDSEVFLNCVSLSEYVSPVNLNFIKDGAFTGSGITKITLPSCSITLSYSKFDGAGKLQEFVVPAESTTFVAIDGVLYSYDKEKLLIYPPAKQTVDFTVHEDCTSVEICQNSFVQSIAMPNVETIQKLNHLSALKKIMFVPDCLRNIYDNLRFLPSLEEFVEIERRGGTNYHVVFNNMLCKSIDETTFKLIRCAPARADETITISKQIQEISDFAFDQLQKAKHIVFEDDAQKKLPYLNFVDIPLLESVEFIPGQAERVKFENCPLVARVSTSQYCSTFIAVDNVLYSYENDGWQYSYYPPMRDASEYIMLFGTTPPISSHLTDAVNLKTLNIREGTNAIPDGFLMGNRYVTNLNIPRSTQYIGDSFLQNSNIATVTFAEGSELDTLSKNSFQSCPALKSLTIPAFISSIPNSFAADTNLGKLEGGKINSIGDNAFVNTAISQFELPEIVDSIGTNAFSTQTFTGFSNSEKSHLGLPYVAPVSAGQTVFITEKQAARFDELGAALESGNVVAFETGDSDFIEIKDKSAIFLKGRNELIYIKQKEGPLALPAETEIIGANLCAGWTAGFEFFPETARASMVTAIMQGAFMSSNITSFAVPESMMYIAQDAFENSGLRKLRVYDQTKIGLLSPFFNLLMLETIECPDPSTFPISFFANSENIKLTTITPPKPKPSSSNLTLILAITILCGIVVIGVVIGVVFYLRKRQSDLHILTTISKDALI